MFQSFVRSFAWRMRTSQVFISVCVGISWGNWAKGSSHKRFIPNKIPKHKAALPRDAYQISSLIRPMLLIQTRTLIKATCLIFTLLHLHEVTEGRTVTFMVCKYQRVQYWYHSETPKKVKNNLIFDNFCLQKSTVEKTFEIGCFNWQVYGKQSQVSMKEGNKLFQLFKLIMITNCIIYCSKLVYL